MQTTATRPTRRDRAKKFGYGVAVVVNAALLVVVINLLDWDLLPFLTEEFGAVVPWISLSLVASIAANLVYQFDDRPTVRAAGDVATSALSLIATYRLLEVFPFDFSSQRFDWGTVVRVLLVVAMVGAGIGILAALGRLVSAPDTIDDSSHPHPG